jgi:putative Mg2+ transporter-C (MgtC) family protein
VSHQPITARSACDRTAPPDLRGANTVAITSDEIFGPLPDAAEVIRVAIRLVTALFIGGVIGLQREITHHAAGLRTHMLVSLGTAVLVVCAHESGMTPADVSRIVQGIVTGIGFLGGGAILKLTSEREIRGLTTAAGIWLTAAVSVAAGLGRIGSALIGAALALFVLMALRKVEKRLDRYVFASKESNTMRIDSTDGDG